MSQCGLPMGIDCLNGLRKTGEAIDTSNQNVLKTPIFQLGQDLQSEFRLFCFGLPNPDA
jgi:hypothetical protein